MASDKRPRVHGFERWDVAEDVGGAWPSRFEGNIPTSALFFALSPFARLIHRWYKRIQLSGFLALSVIEVLSARQVPMLWVQCNGLKNDANHIKRR